ncbi:hypothetical protein GQ53DRAFT_396875 [Thozetella sp. PMI_491]|nr:hypothetical protein GQ53DRAFT_396875 [Thozetella sp. PMI_491]
MEGQHSGSTALPRSFGYADRDRVVPTTPEPFAGDAEVQVPPPPKPRLRLKKRNVSSQLTAPTQQFLASVAAADVPIPSIEEPDFDMIGLDAAEPIQNDDGAMLLPMPRGRLFSPPKTPAPGFVPSLSPPRYPNWTIDSTVSSSIESTPDPDYESSRPSTSHSTQTSASLFSRFSQTSNDYRFASPEAEGLEKGFDEYSLMMPGDALDPHATIRPKDAASRKTRKAPWTKAMSEHVWSTYSLYLADPKVTPFNLAKNGLPPHGVLRRVAREVKRSWKGARALSKAANPPGGRKSGSNTPTAEAAGTFIKWPHSNAATRDHLRHLCKMRAMQGTKLMPRSPAPYPQLAGRHWNRRSTPASYTSAWTTQDMSLSLAVSTAESMQPQGPLAQLTSSIPEPTSLSPAPVHLLDTFEGEPSFAERRRLGSPFSAKSYGPSSSSSLAAALGLSSPRPRRQTIGPRRTLQSPVRMSRSGTMKRRNTQSSEPRKRPTIAPELFDQIPTDVPQAVGAPATEVAPASPAPRDDPFMPIVPSEPLLATAVSMPNVSTTLGAPLEIPRRLGSPFSGSVGGTSFSFPNRLHKMQSGSVDMGVLGRPFATVRQQPSEPTTNPPRFNLAGRLAYLDQRLKELRTRGAQPRSESPL